MPSSHPLRGEGIITYLIVLPYGWMHRPIGRRALSQLWRICLLAAIDISISSLTGNSISPSGGSYTDTVLLLVKKSRSVDREMAALRKSCVAQYLWSWAAGMDDDSDIMANIEVRKRVCYTNEKLFFEIHSVDRTRFHDLMHCIVYLQAVRQRQKLQKTYWSTYPRERKQQWNLSRPGWSRSRSAFIHRWRSWNWKLLLLWQRRERLFDKQTENCQH